MTTKELIESAREGNLVRFEKTFENVVTSRLSEALVEKKKEIVAEMFDINLAEQDLTEEEYEMVFESLSDLDAEQLSEVAEMEIQEAANYIVERFEKGPRKFKTAYRKEGVTGVVRFGAKKLGRAVKRVASSLVNRNK